MNTQRAKDICTSGIFAKITFDGVPVYIQNVDEKTETARIYPLDDPETEQEVAISNLVEH
jgi:small acid-soluble spore protein H (minor)